MVAVGSSGAFAAETGTNLPWEGPLTTLVTSLTGPVAYAISVIAIVALGATLAFRGGEMGETMRHLLQAGIAVCCVVFAAQVMTSFIGQSAEIAMLQPVTCDCSGVDNNRRFNRGELEHSSLLPSFRREPWKNQNKRSCGLR